MLKRIATLLLILGIGVMPVAAYEGLSVSTAFPSIHISDTGMITFDLKVHNYGLSPQRVNLSVTRMPKGWDHLFVGGGGIVDAVFTEPDQSTQVQLWVTPPADVAAGNYDIVVRAQGRDGSFSLPLTIRTGGVLPERLSLDADLPSVKGTPKAEFSYEVELKNNSAGQVLVNLDAAAPKGFQVVFTENYGDKELSTIPIEGGKSKKIKVKVKPPQGVAEGSYEINVVAKSQSAEAETTLSMEIKGQPELNIAGPEGRLSGSAVAGRDTVFDLTLKNSGSAAAKNIKLSGSGPRSWNVKFSPETVDEVAAGESVNVKATVRPSSEAISGDYNVSLRGSSDVGSFSETFRITVRTSTLWGIVAILIIAAAAVVLVTAVRKFGRR
ncbi:COG1470 family protein [Sediminispirochaeta bajacaliforniensis]|uniref:COG1470 family protein n=1 Tax=Sediminispirochaeta bajacaliforniensis TaxID=148 RepID=UPI000375F301|nr:NEW3 domain-containing protein [Sediminispirochaeta bajacaliforniensis]